MYIVWIIMAALVVAAVLLFLSFRKDCIIGDGTESAAGAAPGRDLLLCFFTPAMLPAPCRLTVEEVNGFPEGAVSAVGNVDIANVLGVPYHPRRIKLRPGDCVYLAQIQGGHLPAGSTVLPAGFSFRYLKIKVL